MYSYLYQQEASIRHSSAIVVHAGSKRYQWHEHWVRIPRTATGQVDGRTHGVAITQHGQMVIFHQADPAVLIYSENRRQLSASLWHGFLDQSLCLCAQW